MTRAEAQAIIESELAKHRPRAYADLSAMVDQPKQRFEVAGDSGVTYDIDVYAMWDGDIGGAVRVWVTADDGGWRAFVPVTQTFIKGPDGSHAGGPVPAKKLAAAVGAGAFVDVTFSAATALRRLISEPAVPPPARLPPPMFRRAEDPSVGP